MAESDKREVLIEALRAQPKKLSTVISNRVAMRVLPILGLAIDRFRSREAWRDELVLPLFRAYTISPPFGDRVLRDYDQDIYVNSAIETAYGVAYTAGVEFSHVVAAAANIVSNSEEAPNSVGAISDAAQAAFGAFSGDNAAESASADAAEQDIWNSVREDLTYLENGGVIASLPLWPSGAPVWAQRGWSALKTELLQTSSRWMVWTDWYDDRLQGAEKAAFSGRPLIQDQLHEIAETHDADWAQGSRHINERIQAINDLYWVPPPEASRLPPPPPPQGHGPQFALSLSGIDFAPPRELDDARNDIRRINALLPLLRAQANEAFKIFGRNQAYGRIHDVLKNYLDVLSDDPARLNFDVLAGYGLMLANAESAAARSIGDRLAPEMEDHERTALANVLDLHGPFILATEAGREMLADAERYQRSAMLEQDFRKNAIELSEALIADGLTTEGAGRFIVETARDIGIGAQPERTAAYGSNVIRNVSVLIIGSAALAAGGYSLLTGNPLGWIPALILGKAFERSDVGQDLINIEKDVLDDSTKGRNFKSLGLFVLRNEDKLRAVAGSRREFKWLHDWLDWLKSNSQNE